MIFEEIFPSHLLVYLLRTVLTGCTVSVVFEQGAVKTINMTKKMLTATLCIIFRTVTVISLPVTGQGTKIF